MTSPHSRTNNDDKTLPIELFIATLLRWGVMFSFAIIAFVFLVLILSFIIGEVGG